MPRGVYKNKIRHGMSHTRIYGSWIAMKDRCFGKNNKYYKNYGGRGITICDKWLDFQNFYRDMGERPVGKSLDRIKNDLGYCKENCKWSNLKEQNNNKRNNHRLTFNDKTQTVSQWAEELNLNRETLFSRLKLGWSTKKSLTFNLK